MFELNQEFTTERMTNDLMARIAQGCSCHWGDEFSFEYDVMFCYYEHYRLQTSVFSSKWRLDGESAKSQAAPLLRRMNYVIKKLPRGIRADIVTEKSDNEFRGMREQVSVRFKIHVMVSAEYSKRMFDSLLDGVVIHDPAVGASFRKDADVFYRTLKENHLSLVKDMCDRIVKRYSEHFREPEYSFYFRLNCIEDCSVGKYKILNFSEYGMADLTSMSQAYGMAKLIMELLTESKLKEDIYTLRNYQYFVAVSKIEKKPKLNSW